MKKLFNLVWLMIATVASFAQANVLPAPAQKGVMYVKNATIHVGNGTVIENGIIVVRDGKIEKVGKDIVEESREYEILAWLIDNEVSRCLAAA